MSHLLGPGTIDETLLRAANGLAWPLLDWCGALVKATDLWLAPACVTTALMIWKGSRRVRAAVVLSFCVVAAGDGVVVRSMKAMTNRARPPEILRAVRVPRLARVRPRVRALARPLVISFSNPAAELGPHQSFPSGHAWNAFAVATVAVLVFGRRGALAFVPAVLIALARVTSGLHWPSDVVASALLAPPVALLTAWVADRAWRRAVPRLSRRLADALPCLLEGGPNRRH